MANKVYRLRNPLIVDGRVLIPQWARVTPNRAPIDYDETVSWVTVPGNPIALKVPKDDVVVLKGLTVNVLRHADGSDCTMGGETSRYTRMTLVDPKIDGIFEETEDCPALHIVRRMIGGTEYRHAVPVDQIDRQTMFGGNFVHTSDSRVSRACPPYGVLPVHDRCERRD